LFLAPGRCRGILNIKYVDVDHARRQNDATTRSEPPPGSSGEIKGTDHTPQRLRKKSADARHLTRIIRQIGLTIGPTGSPPLQ
jgi:hypothetical protein